jgi:hypothetical protein
MSTVQGGQGNIVTNGLVLNLDAANPRSYPQPYNGTIWQSISPTSSSLSSVISGSIYTGSNGGALTFDGIDDYCDFFAPDLTTTATIEMWCKIGSSYSNRMFFGWNSYDVWCYGAGIGYNTFNSDVYGISAATVSALGLVNNWKHYIFEMRSDVSYTNNKIYINSTSQTLSQQASSENPSNRNFSSGNGRIAAPRQTVNYVMPMQCAIFRVYNRILDPSEILQNFNATRARFAV